MITKNISKHPKSLVEVTITIPWQDIQPLYEQTFQNLSQEVEIPGFRKGQAPLNMVEPKIAPQVQQEVLKTVMPQALIEALKGTDVVPIDYPQYQVISFNKGTNVQFRAQVTGRPTVTVGNYKAIKVAKPDLKQVTDEDVNKVIEDLFKRWKARQPNLTNPNPTQPPATPQPESQPQGSTGSLSFNQNSPLAQAINTPPTNTDVPNDDFAKAVGAQSLQDLKDKIKKDLEDEAKYNNELDFEEAILQEVEKITQVDIPEVLVQDELNRMLVSLQRRVADMGLLMEDYLKSQGRTLEQLKNEWRPQAEKNVRMELGLAEVARVENVNITDEELQAEIDKIQDAKTKQQFEYQEPRMHLRHALRQTRTLNLLKTLVPQP